MARIPDDEIEQIKTETSLVRLVEHVGIELKKQGKDLAVERKTPIVVFPQLMVVE